MLPTISDVHIDFALTEMAVKWKQDKKNFIYDQVFSALPVKHATNKYFTYNREDFNRDQGDNDMLLAAGAPVKRGGYRMSNDSYSTDVRAWGKPVPREIRANADGGINPEKDAIDYVMTQLMVRLEAQFVTKFFSTSIWGTDLTPTNLWSDFTLSDPKSDMETAMLAIESATGYRPNTLAVGARVDSVLKRHPLIKEQFKYTSDQSLDDDMLKRYFGVERYLVSRAVKATSVEAAATTTHDYIAGKHALLCYSGEVTTEGPTGGRVFAWDGYGNPNGIAIASYYEDQTRSDIIEGFVAVDFKKVSAPLGYFFNGAVA